MVEVEGGSDAGIVWCTVEVDGWQCKGSTKKVVQFWGNEVVWCGLEGYTEQNGGSNGGDVVGLGVKG